MKAWVDPQPGGRHIFAGGVSHRIQACEFAKPGGRYINGPRAIASPGKKMGHENVSATLAQHILHDLISGELNIRFHLDFAYERRIETLQRFSKVKAYRENLL